MRPPTRPSRPADALYAAAAAAGYAPSIHNTQPWRWRLTGDVLELYVDRSRFLEVTDPDARLATLSCGTALHHARTALAAQGWHGVTERLPDPADPDHVARMCIEGPVAIEPHTLRLAQMIRERHTDRRPVTGAPPGHGGLAGDRRGGRSRSHPAAPASAGSGVRPGRRHQPRPGCRSRRSRMAGRNGPVDRRGPCRRPGCPRRGDPAVGAADHGSRARLRPRG